MVAALALAAPGGLPGRVTRAGAVGWGAAAPDGPVVLGGTHGSGSRERGTPSGFPVVLDILPWAVGLDFLFGLALVGVPPTPNTHTLGSDTSSPSLPPPELFPHL